MLLWKWLLFKIRAWWTIVPGSTKHDQRKSDCSRSARRQVFLLRLFTVLKMISLCANCSTGMGEKKNTMGEKTIQWSVREKAGLLKLFLCLAFLFFWSVEASKHDCWRQNNRCDFPTIFSFQWFYSPVGQNFSSKNLYRRIQWVKKKNEFEWFGIACANRLHFFFSTPYLARAHGCRRFVFNPCPREVTMFKDKRGQAIH